MKKTVLWMMAAVALVIGTPDTRAGSLQPTSTPAPTMHTLEEIYQKITNVEAAVSATPGSNVTGDDGALVIAIPDGLYTGSKTATAVDTDLVASNIRTGVTIFGVAGNYAGDGGTGTSPAIITNTYLVIDLSGGPSAGSYPISYREDVPNGGWTEEYKTTKLVLRKIPAGTFTMGSPTNEVGRNSTREVQHQVTISQPFYIGVFEVTQSQWERVMGVWPSYFTNITYRDSRPVEQVSYDMIRGASAGTNWPANGAVDADSFMGKLRARTGKNCDLPTESQWEYAGRAGTITSLNSGQNLTNGTKDAGMDMLGRYDYNGGRLFGGAAPPSDASITNGPATVGSYLPNAWGLYDMHGNLWEWCLDWWGAYPAGPVVDPVGAASSPFRVLRGGVWWNAARDCRMAKAIPDHPSWFDDRIGFRVALPSDP